MKFLDTSFLVDYLKKKDYTLEYLEENGNEVFYASSITLFELFRGQLKSQGESDIEGFKQNINWLNQKELDEEVAEEAAKIEKELEEKGEKINLADVLIAGSARKAGSKIVTGDSDFDDVPEIRAIRPEKNTDSQTEDQE